MYQCIKYLRVLPAACPDDVPRPSSDHDGAWSHLLTPLLPINGISRRSWHSFGTAGRQEALAAVTRKTIQERTRGARYRQHSRASGKIFETLHPSYAPEGTYCTSLEANDYDSSIPNEASWRARKLFREQVASVISTGRTRIRLQMLLCEPAPSAQEPLKDMRQEAHHRKTLQGT
jgi:hypothetical protein